MASNINKESEEMHSNADQSYSLTKRSRFYPGSASEERDRTMKQEHEDDDIVVDDDDIILSQEFFCSQDYVTPDCQDLPIGFDCNAKEIPCPPSPEKPKPCKHKRLKFDSDILCSEDVIYQFDRDVIGMESSLGRNSSNNYVHCPSVGRYMLDFHQIKQIGSGNSGYVFKVLNRLDDFPYAVKRCRKGKQVLNEVKTLAKLGFHEHVVRYHTSWIEDDHHFIQMELCDHDLSIINSFPIIYNEELVLRILHQMAKALQFVHEKGIAHLDVKPDNIYVKDGVYKLGDFGCATSLDSLEIEEGDSRYIAHEILNENYDHLDKADIFSLGLTIYALVTDSAMLLSDNLYFDKYEGKVPPIQGYTAQFQNLLKAMTHPEPVKRPSAKELVDFSVATEAL